MFRKLLFGMNVGDISVQFKFSMTIEAYDGRKKLYHLWLYIAPELNKFPGLYGVIFRSLL